MYGQMTAGSWIYIGTQGILQGTYETLAEVGAPALRRQPRRPPRRHRRPRRHGRRPAARRHDERRHRARRRGRSRSASSAGSRRATSTSAPRTLDDALARVDACRRERQCAVDRARGERRRRPARARPPRRRARRRHRSDVGARRAERLRAQRHVARRGGVAAPRRIPDEYVARSMAAMAAHVARDARAASARRRHVRLRQQHPRAGREGRRRRRVRDSRLRARVHPAALLRGQGAVPLGRAVGRSGRHRARPTTSRSRCSPDDAGAVPLDPAGRASASRSRDCRRASSGSATASARASAWRINDLVRRGVVTAPIVIGRDHLDTGSVASPNRETEGMRDGSDAIADWPVLNALLNTSSRRDVGLGPSRRRRRHRLFAARRHGDRRRRHARSGREAAARAHLRSRHRRRPPRGRGLSGRHRHGASERNRHAVTCCRGNPDDDDPGASVARAARARGARRIGRTAAADPRRPRRLRQRPHVAAAAAARSASAARRRSTSTSSGSRRRRSGSSRRCASRRRFPAHPLRQSHGAASRARATRSTRRWRSSTRRARAGDGAGDVPARRVPRAAHVRELPGPAQRAARSDRRAGVERQPLRADEPLRRARAPAAARRAGAVRDHPRGAAHAPPRSARRCPARTATITCAARSTTTTSRARATSSRGWCRRSPTAVRPTRAPSPRPPPAWRRAARADPVSALAALLAPGGAARAGLPLLLRAAPPPRARLRRAEGDPRGARARKSR